MDKSRYEEMKAALDVMEQKGLLQGTCIYTFGHCNATEEFIELLREKKYTISGILDNNLDKQGKSCKGVPVISPNRFVNDDTEHCVVCIAARAYAAMKSQLRRLGFQGPIYKIIDYNTFADYSLSDKTAGRMQKRVERGIAVKQKLDQKYQGYFKILCPFAALGDLFFVMSYLPYFIKKRNITKLVICAAGTACAQVVSLFGKYEIEIYGQKDMDELVQACLYTRDENSFIAHQDRPYVVNLHKALYVKCIPLEKIYCCGVFGLPIDTKPIRPMRWTEYPHLERINQGNAVIFSPYAKSVTALPLTIWDSIITDYQTRGYQCFTNVTGDEEPLAGTEEIRPQIEELKSVAEWAGTFVGIRSGLCDVIKYAKCEKKALYPDYNYCDTKWKAIDMYAIDGWENIVVREDFVWKRN